MTLLFHELPERLQRRIAANEQVLWCGTRRLLDLHGIAHPRRAAWLLTAAKAREYDLLIGMDAYNIADLKRLVYPEDRPKIRKLLEIAGENRDVADPWYTGDFEITYSDVLKGCTALLEDLIERWGMGRIENVEIFEDSMRTARYERRDSCASDLGWQYTSDCGRIFN